MDEPRGHRGDSRHVRGLLAEPGVENAGLGGLAWHGTAPPSLVALASRAALAADGGARISHTSSLAGFSLWHRSYLMINTLQWLAGMIFVVQIAEDTARQAIAGDPSSRLPDAFTLLRSTIPAAARGCVACAARHRQHYTSSGQMGPKPAKRMRSNGSPRIVTASRNCTVGDVNCRNPTSSCAAFSVPIARETGITAPRFDAAAINSKSRLAISNVTERSGASHLNPDQVPERQRRPARMIPRSIP